MANLLRAADPAADATADALIERFGSFGCALEASPEAIERIAGSGHAAITMLPAAAAAISHTLRARCEGRPIVGTDKALIDYLVATMGDRSREQVRAIYLDRGNHILCAEVVSEGTVATSSLHPRELLRRAIELQASALIIAHNHPGRTAEPSRQDIEVTQRLARLANEIQLTVHDHVIVAGSSWTSMRARGLL